MECPKCGYCFDAKHVQDRGELQKKGMISKASYGKVVSRAPFGYTLSNGMLIPSGNFQEVEQIFSEFLSGLTFTQLSKKHKLSLNGIKKILRNYTYIGKVKFDNQIFDGAHKAILSSTLFNHVQDKLSSS